MAQVPVCSAEVNGKLQKSFYMAVFTKGLPGLRPQPPEMWTVDVIGAQVWRSTNR